MKQISNRLGPLLTLAFPVWLVVLLAFDSFVEVGVEGYCLEQCIPKGFSCAKLFKEKLPFETKKEERPCRFGSDTEGNHTSYCCTKEEDLEGYLHKKRLAEIARFIAGAEEHEYPYHVKLLGKAGCGGTVYNKDWIITAAHCVKYKGKLMIEPLKAVVIAGKSNLNNITSSDKYPVLEAITHDKWNDSRIIDGYDIALLRLNRSLALGKGKIQPVRLERADFVPPYGGNGVVIGYGNVDERMGTGTKYLMEAVAPLHAPAVSVRISLDELNAADGLPFAPLAQHLSVGGGGSGITVGQGDSGGSTICPDEQGKPVLCGIASFKKCKIFMDCHRPSYFVRLAPFIDWVKEKTGNAEQESDLIFDEPLFPPKLADSEVPGYLVRVAGKNKSCSGVLITPNIVVTPAECILANGKPKNVRSFAALYHFKTGKLLSPKSILVEDNFKRDISANISKFTERPLGLNNLASIVINETLDGDFINLAPEGHQLTDPLIEYTMNEGFSGAVESRRYLTLDRTDCQRRLHVVDENLTLVEQHLCMVQLYSADPQCQRDVGGPLVCDGYLCGIKEFHACGFSALPELFTNLMNGTMRKVIELRAKLK